MIDLHSHVLPGLDDGARDIEESLEMARAAAADGTIVLAATPHVREDYPTPAAAMERAVADLRARLDAAGIQLQIVTGGELAIEQLTRLPQGELGRFGLAGNPHYVLLEFPYHGWPLELDQRVFDLHMDGVTPVLAHPERNSVVQSDPERLASLVNGGALVQLTAASVDGRLSRASSKCAFRLLELGLAHLIASDAHAPDVRSIGLRSAADALRDDRLARWLTVEVPTAILNDTPIPDPPMRAPRSRGWMRRRRTPIRRR
ncbi:MAG TPA: CpsB/CapC family capsule biosynthesis tyrosine phosphatase [Gaiellaceae bacterium]